MRKLLAPLLMLFLISASVFSQTIILDSSEKTTTLNSIVVSQNTNFLDLTILDKSSCIFTTPISIEVFFNDSSDIQLQRARYRLISYGEEAHFYIDLGYYKEQTIIPVLKFKSQNPSSCIQFSITNNGVNSRSTHFPSSRYSEIQARSSDFLKNSNNLGVNDIINYGGATLEETENVAFLAKKANVSFIRTMGFPQFNPKTCFSRNIYSCALPNNLYRVDQFFESMADRNIPVYNIIMTPEFDQSLFSNLSQTEKTNFLNLFELRDSYYFDNSDPDWHNWGCNQINSNPSNFFNYRFDLPDWMMFDLTNDLLTRYSNDYFIGQLLNEPNLLPKHVMACDLSKCSGLPCFSVDAINQTERDYLKTKAKRFLDTFYPVLRNTNKTVIFTGLASNIPPNDKKNIWMFDLNEWMTPYNGTQNNYDNVGIHFYLDDGNAQSLSDLNSYLTTVKKFFTKKIIVDEFGYNTINAISKKPTLIPDMRSFISTDSKIAGGAYWELLSRSWMQYFPTWDSYGKTTLFKTDLSVNEPYFSQFDQTEKCDGVDNDFDGITDKGCDDDVDGYADSTMICPLGLKFMFWEYNETWKIQRNWNNDGLWVYESGISTWVWYQKNPTSNIGSGWGVGATRSCDQYSGDTNDNNPNIYPGSTTQVPLCEESDWSNSISPTICPSSGQQTKTWTQIGQCSGGVTHPTSETIVCTYIPECTESDWSSSFSPTTCPVSGIQTRNWTLIGTCSGGTTHQATESVTCNYSAPTCTDFNYSNWSDCSQSGTQSRTITNSTPAGCQGGNPSITQQCTFVPNCTENNWTYSLSPTTCPKIGSQTKTWSKIGSCVDGINHPTSENVACDNTVETCSSFVYSDWSNCSQSGVQTRRVNSTTPTICTGGNPVLASVCTYVAPVIPSSGGSPVTNPSTSSPECISDMNCASGKICSYGKCVTTPNTLACTSSFDCQSTQLCKDGICTQINCKQDYSVFDHNCVCDFTACGDTCNKGVGICCSGNWNTNLFSCTYNIDDTNDLVNQVNDSEARDLLNQASESIAKGNMQKGVALARAAELKALIIQAGNPAVMTKIYEKVSLALENKDYNQADFLAIQALGMEELCPTQLNALVVPAIVISIIIILALILFRKKPEDPKKKNQSKEQLKELLKAQARELSNNNN